MNRFSTMRDADGWGWLPLVVLPAICGLAGFGYPRWVLMWMLALTLGLACKWVTWWTEGRRQANASSRKWAYLLAWPGMNAHDFCDRNCIPPRPARAEWFAPTLKTAAGIFLIWFGARQVPSGLAAGWLGMVGIILLLHFGIFHLLALFWRRAGICAEPIMRAPLLATSVGEFWNRRWNAAFNHLVHRFVFTRVARRSGPVTACLACFLISGLIHELVISVPAGGGYGLPTAYFMVQGGAIILERSRAGRRLGLRQGWPGHMFTMIVTAGPAFWLFHPVFVHNVILPMLKAIGAT